MANSSKIKLPPLNVIPTITRFKKNLLLLDPTFKFYLVAGCLFNDNVLPGVITVNCFFDQLPTPLFPLSLNFTNSSTRLKTYYCQNG